LAASEALTCPKCRGDMRTYERSGIVVDQCVECRGIFLDRGELERLMDAEAIAGSTPGRANSTMARESERGEPDRGHGLDEGTRERDEDGDAWRRRDVRDRSTGPDGRRRESRFGGIMGLFGGD
jgi:uncharacterized protein